MKKNQLKRFLTNAVKSTKELALAGMLLVGAGTVNAQVCTGTANIPPNGTFSTSGVTVTSVSTGFVSTFAASFLSCGVDTISPNSLLVGSSSNSTIGSSP